MQRSNNLDFTPTNAEWGTLVGTSKPSAAGNMFLLNLNKPLAPHAPATPVQGDGDAMQIDDVLALRRNAASALFPPAPQRATLKRQLRYANGGCQQEPSMRRVGFSPSVGVRVSLEGPCCQEDVWYTSDQLRSMRYAAFEEHSVLHHSGMIDPSNASTIRKQVLSSPPSQDDVSTKAFIPRVHSAQAQLGAMSGLDLRRQKILSVLDREVYITNKERLHSTKRRLFHYSQVNVEIDRQCDAGYRVLNVRELAHASKVASGDATVRALEKARKHQTVAQAALMVGRRRL